jgi:hypothetical protein
LDTPPGGGTSLAVPRGEENNMYPYGIAGTVLVIIVVLFLLGRL